MSHNFYAIVIIEPEVTIEELNNEWLCHICQLHMTCIGKQKVYTWQIASHII